jgi:hypothetical protein
MDESSIDFSRSGLEYDCKFPKNVTYLHESRPNGKGPYFFNRSIECGLT